MTDRTALAVEALGWSKSFGSTRAVDGVDLLISSGSIFGLLGPNGAGKTMMVRMLTTLISPDSVCAPIAMRLYRRER